MCLVCMSNLKLLSSFVLSVLYYLGAGVHGEEKTEGVTHLLCR